MVDRSLLPCWSQMVCPLSPKTPVLWRCSHFDRRTACLAISRGVAWRLFHLARLERENPDIRCSVFFEAAGRKAIVSSLSLLGAPDAMSPTLREAGRMMGPAGEDFQDGKETGNRDRKSCGGRLVLLTGGAEDLRGRVGLKTAFFEKGLRPEKESSLPGEVLKVG